MRAKFMGATRFCRESGIGRSAEYAIWEDMKENPPRRERKTDITVPKDDPVGRPDPCDPGSGHPQRPDPTRYGDWEIGGRCIDF